MQPNRITERTEDILQHKPYQRRVSSFALHCPKSFHPSDTSKIAPNIELLNSPDDNCTKYAANQSFLPPLQHITRYMHRITGTMMVLLFFTAPKT